MKLAHLSRRGASLRRACNTISRDTRLVAVSGPKRAVQRGLDGGRQCFSGAVVWLDCAEMQLLRARCSITGRLRSCKRVIAQHARIVRQLHELVQQATAAGTNEADRRPDCSGLGFAAEVACKNAQRQQRQAVRNCRRSAATLDAPYRGSAMSPRSERVGACRVFVAAAAFGRGSGAHSPKRRTRAQ